MATTGQKEAARRNLGKARDLQSARARGAQIPPSHREGDGAWRRIQRAAKRFGVEIEAGDWRSLVKGAEAKRRRRSSRRARRAVGNAGDLRCAGAGPARAERPVGCYEGRR